MNMFLLLLLLLLPFPISFLLKLPLIPSSYSYSPPSFKLNFSHKSPKSKFKYIQHLTYTFRQLSILFFISFFFYSSEQFILSSKICIQFFFLVQKNWEILMAFPNSKPTLEMISQHYDNHTRFEFIDGCS